LVSVGYRHVKNMYDYVNKTVDCNKLSGIITDGHVQNLNMQSFFSGLSEFSGSLYHFGEI